MAVRRWGAEEQVNGASMGLQGNPVLAALPDGGFVAAWVDGSDPLRTEVRFQIFDSSGQPLGPVQGFASSNSLSSLSIAALEGGGGVFVHCAMGKSRSATSVVAYLMWKYGYGRDYALALVCEVRPVCSPNPGFMEQLDVYERMLARPLRDKEGRREIYEAWLGNRFKGYSHEWEARADAATKSKL